MNTASKIITATVFSIFLNNHPLQAQSITLENLPTGNYYYERIRSEKATNQYVLLRKAGHIVAGIEVRSRSGNPCFKGFANQNSVVDATRVFPPYEPASKWEHQKGEALNLNSYRRIERVITTSDQAALMKCIRVFSE